MLVQQRESLSAPCLRHQESLFFQMPPAYNLSPAPCLRLQEHALSRKSCTKRELYKESAARRDVRKKTSCTKTDLYENLYKERIKRLENFKTEVKKELVEVVAINQEILTEVQQVRTWSTNDP